MILVAERVLTGIVSLEEIWLGISTRTKLMSLLAAKSADLNHFHKLGEEGGILQLKY